MVIAKPRAGSYENLLSTTLLAAKFATNQCEVYPLHFSHVSPPCAPNNRWHITAIKKVAGTTSFPPSETFKLFALAARQKLAQLDENSVGILLTLGIMLTLIIGSMLENSLVSLLRRLARFLILYAPPRMLNVMFDKLIEYMLVIFVAIMAGISWLAGAAEILRWVLN
jgi:hypothetical protein